MTTEKRQDTPSEQMQVTASSSPPLLTGEKETDRQGRGRSSCGIEWIDGGEVGGGPFG